MSTVPSGDLDERYVPGNDCDEHHCITCGDDGDPMTVVAVDSARGLALCSGESGRRASVEIALVDPVEVGDVLLVHAGTAIAHGVTA